MFYKRFAKCRENSRHGRPVCKTDRGEKGGIRHLIRSDHGGLIALERRKSAIDYKDT
jgi:hypothetical protein